MPEYDVVVIGGGIYGSSAALQCAKNGLNTLLLEQFTLPHTRGSSHGQTRIIRKAYDQVYYARMMPEAYHLWSQLENDSGARILYKTGLLNVMKKEGRVLQSVTKSLDMISSKYDVLDSHELRIKFPQFKFDDSFQAVVDPDGGVLMAEKAVAVSQEQFKKREGAIRDGEKVIQIKPGTQVEIVTDKASYKSKAVIVAAGAWTNQVISSLQLKLPLQPKSIGVYYWKTNQPRESLKLSDGAPVYRLLAMDNPDLDDNIYGFPVQDKLGMVKARRIDVMYWRHKPHTKLEKGPETSTSSPLSKGYTVEEEFPTFHNTCGDEDTDFTAVYGLPDLEYPGQIKVCSHMGPDIDPDFPELQESDAEKHVSNFIKTHMPGVETTPSVKETCLYTMSPDHDFIIDHVPNQSNIIVAAGMSGHGFKLAPLVGKILYQLATKQTPSYDLSHFRINRFSQSKL